MKMEKSVYLTFNIKSRGPDFVTLLKLQYGVAKLIIEWNTEKWL